MKRRILDVFLFKSTQDFIHSMRRKVMKTKISIRTTGVISLVALILVGFSIPVIAQAADLSYPERTVTLIVPFPPGGVTDLGARTFAAALENHFKQSVIVENKSGGATTIAGNAVVKAKPDGYTLGFFPSSATIPEIYSYFYQAPYSSNDLLPVCKVLIPVLAIAVKADSGWNSLKDFVEYGRKNPGTKYGTHSRSSAGYLVMENIEKTEKLKLVDVPLGGDTKIVPALIGGHVPIGTPGYPSIKSLVEAKQIKALAMLTPKRADFAPDVPTILELGYKLDFVSQVYLGLFAPKGTPEEIIKKISETAEKISSESDYQSRINNIGTQVSYEDTASFRDSVGQYGKSLQAFFKEQGLVK
jgi:tripartite-type tricarboxylate transporter receptor subunit TctC